MSAASPSRSGAASPDARRPAANPWRVDLRELGRRAGSMQELDRTAPTPEDWRVELIGVPAGTEVHLRLRLESVMEGVLVTGEIDAPVTGSCARCLEPIEDTLSLDVQELYAYEGSTTEATSEEDEVRRIEGDHLDLEALARDTVVLALPLARSAPRTARDSAPAAASASTTCPPTTRTRSSTPAGPVSPPSSAPPPLPRRAPPARAPPLRRTDRGCPEAEDVPRQHPFAPLDVEGHRADPLAVPEPRLRRAQAPAPGVPDLRPVRRSPGPLGLSRLP